MSWLRRKDQRRTPAWAVAETPAPSQPPIATVYTPTKIPNDHARGDALIVTGTQTQALARNGLKANHCAIPKTVPAYSPSAMMRASNPKSGGAKGAKAAPASALATSHKK